MGRLEGREERLTWLAVGALTVLALALRLHHFLSPLYFIFAWGFGKLGSAPDLIKLPSLIAGVASIPLIFLVGRKAVGRAAGLIAATVMALMPFMIFYSGDGRTYALAVALLLGSTLAMLCAAESGRTRTWVIYGLLTVLAMYTHYTAAFVLAAQLIWLLWAHPDARKPALLANVGAIVLFIPWIPSMLADLDSPTVDVLSALQGDGFAIKRLATEAWAFGYPFTQPTYIPGHFWTIAITLGVAIAAIAAFVRMGLSLRIRDGVRGRLADADRGMILLVMLALA